MAQIAFHFNPLPSRLHRLDPRLKFLSMVAVAVTAVRADPGGLIWIAPLSVASLIAGRMQIATTLREMRFFLMFVVLIVLARMAAEQSADLSELVAAGLIFGARLMIMICLGLVFSATTTARQIRSSVAWFLRPIPGVQEENVGVMVGLVLTFIPTLFDEAEGIRRAALARCGASRRPMKQRLRWFGLPLILRVFSRVEYVSRAMESRCYDSEHPERSSALTAPVAGGDWFLFTLVVAACVCALAVPVGPN